MRLISTVFLILILQSGSAAAYTILVVGDSISAAYGIQEEEGWVHLAQQTMQHSDEEIQFINASISGDTTAGGVRRLPAALERFNPDLLVIELGGNDGLRGYSTKKLQENLETMVVLAKEADAMVLIAGMRIPSNYGAAYTEQFFNSFKLAAENTDAGYLPFILEPIAMERKYFQRDGVHPTADAQPLMAEHMVAAISQLMNLPTE